MQKKVLCIGLVLMLAGYLKAIAQDAKQGSTNKK